jgi:inner membrane protein
VVVGLFSVLPDIDSPRSFVGRAAGPLSRHIERRWGHRTVTHSYAVQAVLWLALLPLGLVWGWWEYYWAAVLGYSGHVLLDTMTVQGVRVWWPWNSRRGVFPFDVTHPEKYRFTVGGFGDRALGVGCLALFAALALVQHQGYTRLMRLARADVIAAVRDVRAWESEAQLAVELEALHAISQQPLSGTFPIVGAPSDRLLLIRGRDGNVYSVGRALEAHYQGRRVVVKKGAPVSVRTLTLDLAGRLLGDLPALLGDLPEGSEVELFGTVAPLSPVALTRDAWRYNVISGGSTLRFEFASLEDVQLRGLAGVMVRDGALTARILMPTVANGVSNSGPMAPRGVARPVRFSFPVEALVDVRVRVGGRVAARDTLAVVLDPAITRAEEALQVVELAIATQRAQAAAAGAERARRVAAAEERAAAAARRVEAAAREYAAGYLAAAGHARAQVLEQAAAEELRTLRGQPDASALELARLEAERSRKAAELEKLRARAAILAPAPGTVRSISLGRGEGAVVLQLSLPAADTAGVLVL